MPRRRVPEKREILPDPKYGNQTLAKFMNHVMVSGKKSVAEKIVYDAMIIVQSRLEGEELAIDSVKRAIDNLKPPLEVRSRRVGGATYQVPVEVRPRRSTTLAIRWLVDFARARREKTMSECLANEIMDASTGLGAAMKRRDDIQKMAESNKAFAHYRW